MVGQREMDARYKGHFPNLAAVQQKKTSEVDARYNCIAWAFGDNLRHWWPNKKRSYWPTNCSGRTTLEAFEDWFNSDGWVETCSIEYEAGAEKVALYTLNGEPTHAARLLPNGLWTSKLGPDIDLAHSFNDLDGPTYGNPARIFMKRLA